MSAPFQDLMYLRRGSAAQRRASQVLAQLDLPRVLRAYSPLLVGTFPLDLQGPGSDLDIICEVHELAGFDELLTQCFGRYAFFRQRRALHQGTECSITTFSAHGLPLEVFGQPLPTARQSGYRHLLIEHRLLQLGGAAFRAKVQKMRAQGLKTEPAFAAALGWAGPDPYTELLTLEKCDDDELRGMVQARPNE